MIEQCAVASLAFFQGRFDLLDAEKQYSGVTDDCVYLAAPECCEHSLGLAQAGFEFLVIQLGFSHRLPAPSRRASRTFRVSFRLPIRVTRGAGEISINVGVRMTPC